MPATQGKPTPRRPVATPVQKRSVDVVARILAAAHAQLNSAPFGEFTMARVATGARVSVGSIYRYFADKADLLHAVQDDALRELESDIESAIAAAEPTVDSVVSATIDVFHRTMTNRAREYGVFLAEQSDDVMVARGGAAQRSVNTALLAGLRRDRRHIEHDDLALAAEIALALINGLFLGYARRSTRGTSTRGSDLDIIAAETKHAVLAYLTSPRQEP